MKNIKTFEKYSLPNVVQRLSLELMEFILQKFEWWCMRGGLANYSQIEYFEPSFKDPDFPVYLINIKLTFVVNKNDDFNASGSSSFNKIPYARYTDEEKKILPKIEENGDTKIGIEIKIYTPKKKNSFSREENILQIENLLYHEILHSYKDYKLTSKKISSSRDVGMTDYIANALEEIQKINYEYKKGIIFEFFEVAYICSDKGETDSFLSQLHAPGGDHWIEGFLKIRKMSYKEILNSTNKKFLEKKIYPIIRRNFPRKEGQREEILKKMYDIIQLKKEYIFRKIGKILQQAPKNHVVREIETFKD